MIKSDVQLDKVQSRGRSATPVQAARVLPRWTPYRLLWSKRSSSTVQLSLHLRSRIASWISRLQVCWGVVQ